MAIGTDRYASRGDTAVVPRLRGVSIAALSLPDQWRDPLAQDCGRACSRPSFFSSAKTELACRGTLPLRRRRGAARFGRARRNVPARAAHENTRLRGLLGLSAKLGGGYVVAEILQQPEPTIRSASSSRAGRREGCGLCRPSQSRGVVGLVASVDEHSSVVLSWAHPEFRASAIATDGSVVGSRRHNGAEGPGVWLLELQGVLYRQQVPAGTVIRRRRAWAGVLFSLRSRGRAHPTRCVIRACR